MGRPFSTLRTACTQTDTPSTPKDLFEAPAVATPPASRPVTPGTISPSLLELDTDFDLRELVKPVPKPVPKPLLPVRKPAAARKGKVKPRPIQEQMLTSEQKEAWAQRMKGASVHKVTSA